MKNFIVLIILFVNSNCFGQLSKNDANYFGKTFDIGSSATLIYDINQFAFFSRYRELSWNSNVKMSISKRFWIGIQMVPIFTKSTTGGIVRKENFTFYGAFIQADLFKVKNINVFLESSYNRSNMVQQTNTRPLKLEGINYIGFGGGVDVCLNYSTEKNWFAEVGFYNYYALNEVSNKTNYTQYILGINYRFGKK